MNSFLVSNLFLAFVFLLTPSISQSKLFNKSSYVSFELPETWDCKAFEQNWVCHDRYQEKKVEALITLTAKIAGDFDKTDNYLTYLKQEKTWVTQTGEEITSKKMGSDAKYIYPNKFPWVEATHLNSEQPVLYQSLCRDRLL